MSVSDNLRSELRGFQKIQADLSRWKLIVIGAVFSYALGKNGLGQPDASPSLVVLAVAPPLAVFFDALQYSYDLRVGLIAFHLKRVNHRYRAYEDWLGRILDKGVRLWQFSQLANWVPTTMVCFILLVWAILSIQGKASLWASPSQMLLAASATLSLVLLLLAAFLFSHRWRAIREQYEEDPRSD